MPPEPSLEHASRIELLTRRLKIAAHQTRRVAAWWTHSRAFPRPTRADAALPQLVTSARIPLASTSPDAHPVFEAGKRHNVALAAPAFHGLVISPERPFSFWRTLGRVTEAAGYRHGMELAGGCIVPAIGGGLCLLARALFQAALYTDLRILERHGHSMIAVLPPPGVPWGVDATLLWPYVDLRFAPREGQVRLGVRVRNDALIVTVTADKPLEHRVVLRALDERETRERDGLIRHNRIERRLLDARDQVVASEIVATNRSRVLDESRQRRSCLTCNEDGCHARVEVPA